MIIHSGGIACPSCLKTSMNALEDSYSVICLKCDKKNTEKYEKNQYMDDNLKITIKNHKDNGRELLIYGYIRVLWISHCLIYGVDYNSRFPSKDVIQCIMSWLAINESFAKSGTENKKLIKYTNCNQCIERISNDGIDVCHIYGTSSIKAPALKKWKFQIRKTEEIEPYLIIGIVNENKINEIGTFLGSVFNQSPEFGFGVSWKDLSNRGLFYLKVNDIIIMTLDLKNSNNKYGSLKYEIYRNEAYLTTEEGDLISYYLPKYDKIDTKQTYKLAVAMYNRDKITLLEEWW